MEQKFFDIKVVPEIPHILYIKIMPFNQLYFTLVQKLIIKELFLQIFLITFWLTTDIAFNVSVVAQSVNGNIYIVFIFLPVDGLFFIGGS